MAKSKRALLMSAALTGLVAGSIPALTAEALAQPIGGAMSAVDPSGGAGSPAGHIKPHRHRKGKDKNKCKGIARRRTHKGKDKSKVK